MAASVTVIGMVLVTSITVFVQWLIASKTTKQDAEKLNKEAINALNLQKHQFWLTEFTTTISSLLAATDLEIIKEIDKEKIIPLVHKTILMLDPNKEDHRSVIGKINELSLKINCWVATDKHELMRIHGQLIDFSQKIIHHGKI